MLKKKTEKGKRTDPTKYYYYFCDFENQEYEIGTFLRKKYKKSMVQGMN